MNDLSGSCEQPLGAILVGGTSRRMGEDKAHLRWRGTTLLERAAETLVGVLDQVLIVGTDPPEHARPALPVVQDLEPGLGPLGGLATALDRSEGRAVFLLACDLPRVSSELVADLIGRVPDRQAPRAAAWVPRVGDRPQPLCALYTGGCLGPLSEYLATGERRAIEFLDRLDTTVIDYRSGHPLFRPDLLLNVNRPADLEVLERGEA